MRRIVIVLLLVSCTTAAGDHRQATSLLGQPLFAPRLGAETQRQREELLAAAHRAYQVNPRFADAILWLGRRTAYLGRYRESIEVFSRGVRLHPEDARFYRHRGHRYITTRQLDLAVADLERAATLIAGHPDRVEADGLPNALKIPTSTLHFNVWYHLGLAHYLRGDFQRAARAYEECLKVSKNPDSLVATTHWYYMTLRRAGRRDEAEALLRPIEPLAGVIESGSYLQLALMYKGQRSAEDLIGDSGSALDAATLGYGIGNWHLYNGRAAEAERIFETVVSERDSWAAFGYIAAEAELARMRRGDA